MDWEIINEYRKRKILHVLENENKLNCFTHTENPPISIIK
jgi:hypothetical protein